MSSIFSRSLVRVSEGVTFYIQNARNFGHEMKHAVVPIVFIGFEIHGNEKVTLGNTTQHSTEQP